ncbi:MAG: DNA repair and recombination protein RadB [Candidatus Pacearchaeota archaeon]
MAKISAGSYDLNKWLYGGYESDIISVIYGGPGTGKTNFCLLASVSQAKKGKKVIYMDTEGGFSIERIKQLVPENYEEVMKNILLLKPTNFVEQKKDFEKLLEILKNEISLIVVDSMTILYRLELASAKESDENAIKKVNSELVRQMRVLAEIARKRNIPVIVTNQVYNWDESQRMVAGDILKYWGKCLIELRNEKGRRFALLKKHRSLGEKELEFEIRNDGIKKKGWI